MLREANTSKIIFCWQLTVWAIKNFFHSSHPVNHLSELCPCDAPVAQAVNLIPLWEDRTQCQVQCGHCLSPVTTLGTCTLTSEGIQWARNNCCQGLHQPRHKSDQQSAENHFFSTCDSKTSLLRKTTVQVYWVVCSDRAHSLCKLPPVMS